MLYEQVIKEKERIESQIITIQTQLKELPEGNLVCSHTGKYSKWYQSFGATAKYIPKHERWLAEKLAYKKYLSLQLDTFHSEKKAIDFYLRHYSMHSYEAEQKFLTSSDYKELLAPSLQPLSQKLSDWVNSPYKTNPSHADKRIHTTISGNLVRSKSEVLIDALLSKNRIPFRYECALQLNEMFLYPDFTIRHPQTGKFFYWEHFGCMDDPAYIRNVSKKLELYASNGIIPSIQLITTYESKEHPLTSRMVEHMIQYYFLD